MNLVQTGLCADYTRLFIDVHERIHEWIEMTSMRLILELQRSPPISSSSMNRLLEIALPECIRSEIFRPKHIYRGMEHD
jgi:hypothetical protein